MVTTRYSTLDDLQQQVVDGLLARNVNAQSWHSGGGIFGILITMPSTDTLFTTLDSDGGHDAWTGVDWSDNDGDLVATLQVQVRPYQSKYGTTGEVDEFVAALANIEARIR